MFKRISSTTPIDSHREIKVNQIGEFKSHNPVRVISLLTYRHFIKVEYLNILSYEIRKALSEIIPDIKKEMKDIEI